MPCETADQQGFRELIRKCLRPVRPSQRQPLPIVVLWSPNRSGKSELLDHVYKRFCRGRPAVRRDTWVRRGVGPPTLHPLARRVLLHQLAKPGWPGWEELHAPEGGLVLLLKKAREFRRLSEEH